MFGGKPMKASTGNLVFGGTLKKQSAWTLFWRETKRKPPLCGASKDKQPKFLFPKVVREIEQLKPYFSSGQPTKGSLEDYFCRKPYSTERRKPHCMRAPETPKYESTGEAQILTLRLKDAAANEIAKNIITLQPPTETVITLETLIETTPKPLSHKSRPLKQQRKHDYMRGAENPITRGCRRNQRIERGRNMQISWCRETRSKPTDPSGAYNKLGRILIHGC